MDREKKKQTSSNRSRRPHIPDIEIIDLEKDADVMTEQSEDLEEISTDPLEEFPEDVEPKEKPRKRDYSFYMHFALLATVFIVIALIAYRLTHWIDHIDQKELFQDGPGVYVDTNDQIVPLTDETGNILPLDHDGNGITILALGNAPFADDRDSKDSLAAMIEEMTDATVINCAVSGSYMAESGNPMDMYTPYWLTFVCLTEQTHQAYIDAPQNLGEDLPPEADYVFETLSTLDLNTVDVVTIMYDASDYLLGHAMYSDDNSTDVGTFTGNMEATIELLQAYYPHIRIIVMSPTYAFAIDEKGDYVSSDIQRYGWDVLSTYAIRQCYSCVSRNVTFVDHLYGTITEDNASEYLTDNLHLNVDGRRLVAERFAYALNFYGL